MAGQVWVFRRVKLVCRQKSRANQPRRMDGLLIEKNEKMKGGRTLSGSEGTRLFARCWLRLPHREPPLETVHIKRHHVHHPVS